jgi:hypothetical protein
MLDVKIVNRDGGLDLAIRRVGAGGGLPRRDGLDEKGGQNQDGGDEYDHSSAVHSHVSLLLLGCHAQDHRTNRAARM